MVTYNCKRCGYSTDLKGNIKRHFNKKKICKNLLSNCSIEECIEDQLGESSIDMLKNNTLKSKNNSVFHNDIDNKCTNDCNEKVHTPTCTYCGQTFKHFRYLDDHLRRSCKYIKNTMGNRLKPYIEEVQELKNELHIERIHRKKDQEIINELKKQIDVLLKGKGNIYNYSQNIIVQPFGKENLSYIKGKYVNDLINEGAIHCIPRLLKHIHFNSEHQENQNIKIPNKKQSLAQVFNGNQWEYTDKQNTIDNMADKALTIINEHYDGSNKYMDKLTDQIINKDKDIVKKISKNTELMILNHQESSKEIV
tara:strand:- start:4481 stop:5404 length:924 start_codon:yes stop_codon:yes gene_type:complete